MASFFDTHVVTVRAVRMGSMHGCEGSERAPDFLLAALVGRLAKVQEAWLQALQPTMGVFSKCSNLLWNPFVGVFGNRTFWIKDCVGYLQSCSMPIVMSNLLMPMGFRSGMTPMPCPCHGNLMRHSCDMPA